MKISETQKEGVREAVLEQLRYVISTWNKIGDQLSEEVMAKSATAHVPTPSSIPGHPVVHPHDPKVEYYVALVSDIRDSTRHLTVAEGRFKTSKDRLYRVHMEMAAISAATAYFVSKKGGAVTEFLGDGVLAMFAAHGNSDGECIQRVYGCGCRLVQSMSDVVNPLLHDHGIPRIEIGVGIGYSQAIVTLIGGNGSSAAKAIGSCVFNASKLSGGRNQVVIDRHAEAAYPESKDGSGISFVSGRWRGEFGYTERKTDRVHFKTRR